MKNNLIKVVIVIIAITSISTLGISIKNIISWKIDSNKTNKIINQINEITSVEEATNDEKAEIVNPPEEKEKEAVNDSTPSPYWNYIKVNMINIDFSELKIINNNTRGWIKVNGTNVNYPFVQATDNKYYLTHSFDKSYNQAGWVFLDYRNNINDLNKNTIIYAHGRLDTTMFGSLRNTLSNAWYNNTDNHIIRLSTERENTLWQIFSIYRIPETSDYLQITFDTDETFMNFINLLKERSKYPFNAELNVNDKILTLSTCYSDSERMVIHAKLIKKEVK